MHRLDELEQEVAKHERYWRLVTGKTDTGDLDQKALYLDVLANMFSEDELRTLCVGLGVDYDGLPGESKFGKARELILYCERHNRIPRLYRLVREERPFLFTNDDQAPQPP